jgi:glycosyltransferase involved in cell wall biosynthesis
VPEPTLSAVVICYRDAPAIAPMHARLTEVFLALGVGYEIIFVNDASPDEADVVLKELTAKDDHVLAIEHSRNFGSQNAFVSGIELATGDAVILLDGDLQDPPELIAAFYAQWRQGSDVVYGRRSKRQGSAVLALCCAIFYRIFRGLSDVRMPLDAGDFALMDRKVVNALLALPETDQFLRGLRAWVGFTQTGVDYVRPERAFGRSTHGRLKNVWWAKKGIFSFSFLPIEILGYAGASMTALSFLALGYLAVDALRRPAAPHGTALVVALVAFFGSLQLLALAVLGEYVIKIVEETKRRPKFIRKAIRHGSKHLVTARELARFVRERSQDPAARQRLGREAPDDER